MEWLTEYLKQYVSEDKLEEAVETFKKDVFPKNAIGKDKFNELNEELKLAKGQLEEKNSTIEKLSSDVGNIDEWKAQLETVKSEAAAKEEEYQAKVSNITKKSELEKLLMTNNAHKDSVDLLLEKYIADVELNDGQIKDADSLVNKIKEERSGLFIGTTEDSTNKDEQKKNPTKLNPFEQVFNG